MSLVVETQEFSNAVSKVSKCVSNNTLIALTSLINVVVEDNYLYLTATDGSNFLTVKLVNKLDCEDLEFSVDAELFSKLVSKITSPKIEMSLNDDRSILTVKANGKYTIPMLLDEDGNSVKFPKKIDMSKEHTTVNGLKLTTIKDIITNNKSSLATSIEVPALTMYYCKDRVVTSDVFRICETDVKLFDEPYLLSANLMNLLYNMSCEDIDIEFYSDSIVFRTEKEVLYAPVYALDENNAKTFPINTVIKDTVGIFPINSIDTLLNIDFKSNCSVSKLAFENVLDRISLFVSKYDKKSVYLTFTQDGLMVTNKASDCAEHLNYSTSENFVPYSCGVELMYLKQEVASISGDKINFGYGGDVAIKIEDGNSVKIIALTQEEEV